MIVKTNFPDYLMHYGVSINDGAPGVGTGNWRRGGSSNSRIKEITDSFSEYESKERYNQNKPKSIIRRTSHKIKEFINESKKDRRRKFTDKVVAHINQATKLAKKYGLPDKEVVEAIQELDTFKDLGDDDKAFDDKFDMIFEYSDRHAYDIDTFDRYMREKPELMNSLVNAKPKEQTEFLKRASKEDASDDDIDVYAYIQVLTRAKSIDWYNSFPKNKEQAKIINDIHNAFSIESDIRRDPKEREVYRQKIIDANERMIEQALKDIGWEVTPENIRLMRPIIIWD